MLLLSFSLICLSHATNFEGVARLNFNLCASNKFWPLSNLNIFLNVFELVCFSRSLLWLSVNGSIFGTTDRYLQKTGLPQRVSQILWERALFLLLAVAKLISCFLNIFRQLALLLLLICLLLHFELYHNMLESMLH